MTGEPTTCLKLIRHAGIECFECLVSAECLAGALERHEKFGIWGGMSERGRKRHRAGLRLEQVSAADFEEAGDFLA